MNNLRLLAGLLSAGLLSAGVCADAQTVVSLEEVFATAEACSAQLRPSLTAVAEAGYEADVARAARLPEIDATLSLSYIGDGFTTKRDFSDARKAPIPHFGSGLGVNVSQPVYTGGAITAGIDIAGQKSVAARLAADFQRDNIRFQLTGFYLDIYKYTNLRKVVESNIGAARKVLAEMKARYEQGTALLNDITRYELLVSNLGLQLTSIDNTLEILNNNLVTTAGFAPGTVIAPDTTILKRSLPCQTELWWQTEAQSASPTLGLARAGADICRSAERLAQAARLPKVSLQAGWTIDGPILVEVPPVDRNLSYWFVGVGVSYNLSSLYKADKSIAGKRAATRRAVEEFDVSRQNLAMAVKADHVRYLEAYEELKTREKARELAERNYSTVATRYSEGMALITDMLDAANARLDAGQQLVNARINIIYYYYKLLFISGTI